MPCRRGFRWTAGVFAVCVLGGAVLALPRYRAAGTRASAGIAAPPPEQLRGWRFTDGDRLVVAGAIAPLSITIQPEARLRLGFGLSSKLWEQGLEEIDFVATFESDSRRVALMRHRLARDADRLSTNAERSWRPVDQWQEREVDLAALAHQAGRLRLETEVVKGTLADPNLIFWSTPVVRPHADDPRPNIVLFSIDTLRADHLGSYGYYRDTSPTLDAMARQGVLFRQAIAPSSWTLPSHASMLTGLNPAGHGARRFSFMSRISETVPIVPELLWRSGYATAAFTDGGMVSTLFGFGRGFEIYAMGSEGGSILKNSLEDNIKRAGDWIDTTEGQPFFLFLHTYAVHLPYAPPPPYDRMFDDPHYDGPCPTQVESIKRCGGAKAMDARAIEHFKALYDGEIRSMDALFSRFISMLRARGLADRTCVVITSDHGEEFKEHGNVFHNHARLYEELIHVPLIFWCPERFTPGRTVAEPVSLIDIAPTLLELAGVPIPESMEGVSLMPTLVGRASPPRSAILSEVDGSIEKRAGFAYSLRGSRYKLISSSWGAAALFDLLSDPGESRDVSAVLPDVALHLRQELAARIFAEQPARVASQRNPRSMPTPDPAVQERLRVLGYIE